MVSLEEKVDSFLDEIDKDAKVNEYIINERKASLLQRMAEIEMENSMLEEEILRETEYREAIEHLAKLKEKRNRKIESSGGMIKSSRWDQRLVHTSGKGVVAGVVRCQL